MFIMLFFLPLNDVTTTYPDPPQFKTISGQKSEINYAYQAENVDKQKQLHPEIQPLKTNLNPADAFKLVEQVARAEGWEIASVDPINMRLEAISTTTLLRFKDDVVIEVRTAGTSNCSIHMRSKSRVGKGDLGANSKRIKSFFAKLKAKF